MFIYLSINDIVATFTVLFIQITMKLHVQCNIINIFLAWNETSVFISVMFFSLISGLRLVKIKMPFQHISTKVVQFIVLGIIFVGYGGGATLFWTHTVIHKNSEVDLYLTMQHLTNGIMCIDVNIVLIINLVSYLHLRRHSRSLNQQSSSSSYWDSQTSTNKTSETNKKEAAKTLLLMALFYSLCMSPFSVFIIVTLVKPHLMAAGSTFLDLSCSFIVMNGGINSLIYILRTKEVRSYYYKRWFNPGQS
uniref:G-protein coupled receptors family 1 profile domain-containing protein n=1 Tax=Clytia hemisphaerica TaxID=252671 RepID=A0A7M5U9H0_9CNID